MNVFKKLIQLVSGGGSATSIEKTNGKSKADPVAFKQSLEQESKSANAANGKSNEQHFGLGVKKARFDGLDLDVTIEYDEKAFTGKKEKVASGLGTTFTQPKSNGSKDNH